MAQDRSRFPAVTRAIAALDDRLGVKLFSRTTRYVRMIDAGQRGCKAMHGTVADSELGKEDL
jgi:DNA-binding transcriptional LysR family regulator